MNGLVILRKARITLLSLLVLFCLAWVTLFAIFLTHEWPYSAQFQNILVVGFLSLHVVTAILLCLMAVLHLPPVCDVAIMLAILLGHIVCSVFLTQVRPSFPCRGFDTETACKEFIFAISVGCWVLSVIILCFLVALGVMAFIPHLNTVNSNDLVVPLPPSPVYRMDDLPSNPDPCRANERTSLITHHDEPQPEEESSTDHNACLVDNFNRLITPRPVDSLPSNHDRFMVGSPTTGERRTFLSPPRTGLVTHNNELHEESWPPGRNTSPVNSILEPPNVWQNSRIRNSGFSNESGSHSGTNSVRNTLGGSTSTDSGSRRVSALSPHSFHDSSPPRVSFHSRVPLPMIRPGVEGENVNRPRVPKISLSGERLSPLANDTARSSIANPS